MTEQEQNAFWDEVNEVMNRHGIAFWVIMVQTLGDGKVRTSAPCYFCAGGPPHAAGLAREAIRCLDEEMTEREGHEDYDQEDEGTSG